MLSSGHLRIGDTARFPITRLGDDAVYRHRFEIHAFSGGSVVMRRLHDGYERTVSVAWFERYRTLEAESAYYDRKRGDHPDDSRGARLEALRQKRRAQTTLQGDPTQPGFYVSARKGTQHALLLGPFSSHYDALQMVSFAWPIVRRYDDPFCEVAVGTCKRSDSLMIGRFNAEVLTTPY